MKVQRNLNGLMLPFIGVETEGFVSASDIYFRLYVPGPQLASRDGNNCNIVPSTVQAFPNFKTLQNTWIFISTMSIKTATASEITVTF